MSLGCSFIVKREGLNVLEMEGGGGSGESLGDGMGLRLRLKRGGRFLKV